METYIGNFEQAVDVNDGASVVAVISELFVCAWVVVAIGFAIYKRVRAG